MFKFFLLGYACGDDDKKRGANETKGEERVYGLVSIIRLKNHERKHPLG